MKIYKFLILIAFLFLMISCVTIIPRIKGVVLDEETKEPVKDGWIWAGVETEYISLQGDISGGFDLVKKVDHKRTNEKGEFVIPLNISWYNPIKWLLRWKILGIAISVYTLDLKEAHLYLKWKELKGKLKKDIKIYVKPIEKLCEEYWTGSHSHMVDEQKLMEGVRSDYFSLARGAADYIGLNERKYDEWELNYAIKINEAFIEKYEPVENVYSSEWDITLENLGYLYTKKGDYEKAIEYYEKTIEYELRHNFTTKDVEYLVKKIKNLQNLLEEKNKK